MIRCKRLIFSALTAASLCGCVTERLENSTANVGACIPDLESDSILKNIVYAHVDGDSVPSVSTLASGTITVTCTLGLTPGYSETWPAITPSTPLSGSTVNQQTFGTTLVNNAEALADLRKCFMAAAWKETKNGPPKPTKIDITVEKQVDDESHQGHTKSLKTAVTIPLDFLVFSDALPPTGVPVHHFEQTYKGVSVYVPDANLQHFTDFSNLVKRIIDAVPVSKASSGALLEDNALLR